MNYTFACQPYFLTPKPLVMAAKKNEHTSSSVASKAAKLLGNPNTPKVVKSVAALALTQTRDKKK
jgi:hypothetical protein